MILAMVDADNRLRIYRADDALTEIGGLQLKGSPDPAQLARIVHTMTDMADSTNGHQSPTRGQRTALGKARTQKGYQTTAVLGLLSDGVPRTAADIRTAIGAEGWPKSSLSSLLTQLSRRGRVQKTRAPGLSKQGRPIYVWSIPTQPI